MIVALFGRSGCGKTSLAEIISNELGIPVRHCGKEIWKAAAAAGLSLSELSDETHRLVDRQSRVWCAAEGEGMRLIEGRFLDHVLAGLPDVAFVRLTAPVEERARRLAERVGSSLGNKSIVEIDDEDDLFRCRLYHPVPIDVEGGELDTGGGDVHECAQKLILLIKSLETPGRG
jgi:cytidylate kinase